MTLVSARESGAGRTKSEAAKIVRHDGAKGPADSQSARHLTQKSALNVQRSVGNDAVVKLIQSMNTLQRETGSGDTNAVDAGPQTPGETATTSASVAPVDQEGNTVASTGERSYLTAIPPSCTWHRGKAEALPPNPMATYEALVAQVTMARDAQQLIAQGMKEGNDVVDMKYWFAEVYYFVTKLELEAILAGTYQYPLMKMYDVINFQATYAQNIGDWESGNTSNVESNWKAAFADAENSTSKTTMQWAETILTYGATSQRSQEIMNALVPSIQAHIRFDLPRAMAAAFEQNYLGIPSVDFADFRSDFESMDQVFENAQINMQTQLDEYCDGSFLPDPGSWHWLQGLGFPFVFDISSERLQAWEKADAIVGGHIRGIQSQSQLDERLRAFMAGAHPLSSDGAFSVGDSPLGGTTVGGTAVGDYDWGNQPSPK